MGPQPFVVLDGEPHYFAGPKDTEQRIDLVLRILTAKLGPDGFWFTGSGWGQHRGLAIDG